jgi:hypothetical protein
VVVKQFNTLVLGVPVMSSLLESSSATENLVQSGV